MTEGDATSEKGKYIEKEQNLLHYDERIFKDSMQFFLRYINGKVLEVGCATGACSVFFDDYTGIDTSEVLLDFARKKHGGKFFVYADAEKIPYKDKVFDTVFCFYTLHHIKDYPQALREMRRVGKRVVIAEVIHSHRKLVNFIASFFPYTYFLDEKELGEGIDIPESSQRIYQLSLFEKLEHKILGMKFKLFVIE